MVDTPGDACWIDGHRDEEPRVDGGPTSPDEVPLSGAELAVSGKGAALFGKLLAAAVVTNLGLGYLGAKLFIHAGSILFIIALAIGLDAYQRWAIRDE